MPNLTPPLQVVNSSRYKKRIEKAIPTTDKFDPLMTLYLTEKTNKNELKSAYKNGDIFAVKLYPAGATTNSDSGVKDIKKLCLMGNDRIGIPLLIHGEVTDKGLTFQ